jgi:hypothetical protein
MEKKKVQGQKKEAKSEIKGEGGVRKGTHGLFKPDAQASERV